MNAIPYHGLLKYYKGFFLFFQHYKFKGTPHSNKKNFFQKVTTFAKIIPHISGKVMALVVARTEKTGSYGENKTWFSYKKVNSNSLKVTVNI